MENVIKAGADWVHFDVMDNHFVPNLTIGPLVCKSLRTYGITAPIDVHLMTQPVSALIKNFAAVGATYISFHPEASANVEEDINLIHDLGCKAGLAINPDKPLTDIESHIEKIDMILIMSVFPGFAGQKFIPEVLPKVAAAKNLISKQQHTIRLEIDGGINQNTIKLAATAGVDTFVAGSAVFDNSNYTHAINALKNLWL